MNYTQTASRAIVLKAPRVLTSGYLGRGIPSKAVELPAGAQVHYTRTERGESYIPFVEVNHTVRTTRDSIQFSACCTEYKLRAPFSADTYFAARGAFIERLPNGLWSTATAGAQYVADDGFGNLIAVPDQTARPGHYSTAKSVEDCVVGLFTWIPRV